MRHPDICAGSAQGMINLSVKLSTHCCCTNLKATSSLELCSYCADPALSFYVAYHFVAELLLFPVASTLL
ncbi:unnamed protein product [Staurois parvus]|uniref:Uncharacterized protein n=1 Tax=Staurois parvus TaxID=386267 RepID=A0ABN9CHD7_9NEOB|nr:unnamed protein product [Staurois parvus]